MAPIGLPIEDARLSFDIHMVDADPTIFISVDDMDQLEIYLNNVEDVLFHRGSGTKAPVTPVCSHPFIWWSLHTSCLLKYVELR